MEEEPIFLILVQDMKGSGSMINFISKECLLIQMGIDMKEYLIMDKRQQKGFIFMQLIDLNIRESGLEIKEVAMVE